MSLNSKYSKKESLAGEILNSIDGLLESSLNNSRLLLVLLNRANVLADEFQRNGIDVIIKKRLIYGSEFKNYSPKILYDGHGIEVYFVKPSDMSEKIWKIHCEKFAKFLKFDSSVQVVYIDKNMVKGFHAIAMAAGDI